MKGFISTLLPLVVTFTGAAATLQPIVIKISLTLPPNEILTLTLSARQQVLLWEWNSIVGALHEISVADGTDTFLPASWKELPISLMSQIRQVPNHTPILWQTSRGATGTSNTCRNLIQTSFAFTLLTQQSPMTLVWKRSVMQVITLSFLWYQSGAKA